MNITILTYGSRGDIQPFLPLSLGLIERGYNVILAAPKRFKSWVEEHGITFLPLAGDPEDLSRSLNDAGYNFVRQVKELMSHAVDIGAEMLRQTEEACRSADLIIHTFAHTVGAHTLAREKNIPDIHIQTFPMFTPTGDYPNVTLPNLRNRFLNRLTHTLSIQVTMLTSRLGFEQVRRRAGLPKRTLYSPFKDSPPRLRTPILCAWSPVILPRPGDWGGHIHVTGYFFLDKPNYQPPDDLSSFLANGKPPVCVSFGSMVNREAERIDRVVREALKQTNHRGIVLSGWGGMMRQPTKDLLYLESVPHDWLLPRCKMLIHHGGAGTTAAGLRAGIPQVVAPFTADQPFWGGRVHTIGVGPRPVSLRNLSAGNLVRAIAEAESNAVLERAQATGRKIRGEDGVKEAVRVIESHAAAFAESPRFFKV